MSEKSKKGMLAKIGKKYNKIGENKKWKPWQKNTAKTAIDITGAGVGTAGAFGTGIISPLIAPVTGIVLLGLGHFLGDKTGVMRVIGASMFGYGLAKVTQKDELDETIDGLTMGAIGAKAKRRLGEFKNEWMKAFFIDKIVKPKSSQDNLAIDGFGAIDLSAMDAIEESVKQSAIQHEMNQMESQEQNFLENAADEDEDEISFVTIPEDEIDLSTI